MTEAARIERHDGVADVVFDVPDRSVNILSVEVLTGLVDTLAAAADEAAIRAIVLRSGKQGGFCGGADVDAIGEVHDIAEGTRLASLGQEAYARIERLPKPVVCAIHGPCVGGGLELALACHGIIASHEPKTRLGLPEVQLGIVPGFGGTQRLPRRVGPVTALDLILTGRMLRAKKAHGVGLVDDIVCPFKLVEEARRYAFELADGGPARGEKRRRGILRMLQRLGPVRRFVAKKAREGVLARTRGVYPAPLRAIGLVELAYAKDRQEGYRREAATVGEMLGGDIAHNLVGLFQKTEVLKRAAGDARGLNDGDAVGVVGAGVMGAAIARLLLKRGARVRLVDVAPDSLQRGVASIAAAFARDSARGRIGRHEATAAMDRLLPTTHVDGLSRSSFVIEAVVERLDVKQQVFESLLAATPDDSDLYTNTSSIPVTSITEALRTNGQDLHDRRDRRILGMHFFNPVDRMPLVEVVVAEGTPDQEIRRTIAIVRDLGKVPVVVKDSPGFVVNRVLAPYLGEALLLLEEGADPFQIDNSMRDLGFPMGPLRVLDTVGHDVVAHVAASLRGFLGERMPHSSIGALLVEHGHLGDKSNGGIFVARARGQKRRVAPWLDGLLKVARNKDGVSAGTIPPDDLRDRLFLSLVAEAIRAKNDGIVDQADALDAAMVLGAGFPANLGGPLVELKRQGPDVVERRLSVLRDRYGARFSPPAIS